MTTYGYFLASEEHDPAELIRQALMAEDAGFDALWISDHFHPWLDEQGESSFVWSVIGALSQATSLPVTTAVTCPLVRTHPAIIAQAAATSQLCWDPDQAAGRRTAHRLWPNTQIPGEAAQLLPLPRHFGQLSELVTEEKVGDAIPCGPDAKTHIDAVRAYTDAGFDEVYVNQIGPDQRGFFDFYANEVLPELR